MSTVCNKVGHVKFCGQFFGRRRSLINQGTTSRDARSETCDILKVMQHGRGFVQEQKLEQSVSQAETPVRSEKKPGCPASGMPLLTCFVLKVMNFPECPSQASASSVLTGSATWLSNGWRLAF